MQISALISESFFGSLKNEWCHRLTFETRAKARTAVIWYIESFYYPDRTGIPTSEEAAA
ncbi:MAG: IS3 family transposase [Atopobiaceae bacterium]|nr:IS3 family transposase [Atopobiaceae bacterium]